MNNFILILLLAAFPALSTDMYLPAIPLLCELWDIPLTQANLSLAVFFISFSAFLLLHGPLADRYGRRPVLLAGVGIYIAASVLCAGSTSITMLVLARVLQALGASAASAMCLALAKDLYQGERRKKVLAYIGVLIPLCPMIAPSIGALLLTHLSWRGIFLFQALLALPALYGSFRLQEPSRPQGGGGLGQALQRYANLARNKAYMAYAVAFSLAGFAFFAFIGGSSDIYIREYGISEQGFSMFFALNALGMMTGALACSRLCVGIESRKILYLSLFGMLAGGLLLLALGAKSPLAFALPMFVYSLFLGMSRPISNHVILEQVNKDTGTAASLLTFFIFLCGGLAMEAISFDWPSKPLTIGVMAVAGSVIPLLTVFGVGATRQDS